MQPLTEDEANETANLFAKLFIARSDIKAVQLGFGGYNPLERPWSRQDLLDHISGKATYGHYMLNQQDECKLIVFDVDLDKADEKKDIWYQMPITRDEYGVFDHFQPGCPRTLWLDRSAVIQRAYFKIQLRMMADKLSRAVRKVLGVQVAATYTGSKGIHVYAFTGKMKAIDAQDGAKLVLDSLRCFEPWRGNAFYRHVRTADQAGNYSPELSYEGMTVEVFPKQISLEGKTHGNLVRLPLGTNLKNPQDPTFFLDFRTAIGDGLTPRPAVEALTTPDYWA